MAGIGHNNGPTLEPGYGWRKHSWTKARGALLPKLPIEVVRLRVKRAQALGLPYKTYAGIRASTGHDLVGFLFSSNGLGVVRPRDVPSQGVTTKLAALSDCTRIGLAQGRVDLSETAALDGWDAAPVPHASWADVRDRMKAIVRAAGHPADRWVLVGDTPQEREWAQAAQIAGYLSAPVYFAA